MRFRIGVMTFCATLAAVMAALPVTPPDGPLEVVEGPIALVADRAMAGPPGPFCRNTAWGRSLEAFRVGDGTVRLTIHGGLPGDSILGHSMNGFPYRNAFAQIQLGQSWATTPNFLALLDLDYLFTAENGAKAGFQCRD